jgi:broad specificity phosphatase PhoE
MTIFYICRHGETENNKMRRLSGWIDTPLTEKGVGNALASASKLGGLHFDQVLSSDLGRAFITAYIIRKKLGIAHDIKRVKELREVNYGDLANRPYAAYPDLSPQANTDYLPPNGESLVQMQARVLGYVDHISVSNRDQNILIVAHDGTINALRANFSNESMGDADTTHNAHDFVAKFSFADHMVMSFVEI